MVTYEILIDVQMADIELFRGFLATATGAQDPLSMSFKRRISDAERCIKIIRETQDRKALKAL